MNRKSLLTLGSLMMLVCLIVTACGGPQQGGAGGNTQTAPFEPKKLTGPCNEGDKVKEIAAVDANTVKFTLCVPDPAFLAEAAFVPFAVQPAEWIEKNGGAGELLEHPIGTGPYMIEKWERGDSITLKRFDDYWGTKAKAETVVFRWATESAARLLELQSGTVHQISQLAADDFAVVEGDSNLQLLPQANPNIFYLGWTNTFEPWNNQKVRQAIAMGIDRQRVVDNFFPTGSTVATHFTPCDIPHGCDGDSWYTFDPDAAKKLLAEAGFPDGFKTKLYYRDVYRVYLPEPSAVAVELQTQLKENLNIEVEVVVMESGEFIDESTSGRLDGLYMLGWGADYMHITNFLDYHFGRNQVQFGTPYSEIYEKLEKAAQLMDPASLYVDANNAIRELVPMIPMVHGAAAFAARADLKGAHVPPLGTPRLYISEAADGGPIVYMQNAEPISLYCTDETDGESLGVCEQILEGLFVYNEKGEAVPALAESFEANEMATEWTFHLRPGVKFHDGSLVDANDVVVSWSVGLDVANPLHKGNTGSFQYPANLFGLINE